MVSSTVTVELLTSVRPATSVTVIVTVLAPTLAQVKLAHIKRLGNDAAVVTGTIVYKRAVDHKFPVPSR